MGKRSSAHVKAQRAGRVRDFGTCQICGSTQHAEGHHIIDHQFSGAANAENIVTLCHECHTRVHKGLISLLKI